MRPTYDHLLDWRDPHGHGFLLELWDTNRTGHNGKSRLAYRFSHNGRVIFQGDDFFCSPLLSVDSPQTVGCLLSFLSLRPGDTDDEYFESYSPGQVDWALEWGETLSVYADDLETLEGWEENEDGTWRGGCTPSRS